MTPSEQAKVGIDIFEKFSLAVPADTPTILVLAVAVHFSRACAQMFAEQESEDLDGAKQILASVDTLRETLAKFVESLVATERN